MLRNPHLFPYFIFDAQHLSKFDGNTFVSFVDEPFTVCNSHQVLAYWHIYCTRIRQNSPPSVPQKVIQFSKPTDCNSKQARCRWWVKDKKLHSGKPSWVDFKNTVWHKSFARIISSLASKSQTGQWFKCLDGVQRWFFLCILILSADFEEQSVMSLTQGIMSLWPCPVCLVPRDDLWDTSKSYCW
ncbi:uncharacterized protein EDB91DRAFT_1083207 [Suillus paluster]|uniref:uncharacterized protein n=1 Tax=Suillus paluster TaxID=48578 RepID=UPI001B879B53|nr:uncharacterized protein EDB91DRAFT_1083207 [Suillus paluster]KAG1736847.1 hypothetical protein EDB91DRAFT_1083207 [Suillus paluster]